MVMAAGLMGLNRPEKTVARLLWTAKEAATGNAFELGGIKALNEIVAGVENGHGFGHGSFVWR